MPTTPNPYIPHNPGDLITAEDWDDVQIKIQEDITNKIDDAVKNIKSVDQAADAGTLGGKTSEQLEDEIVKKVLQEIPKRNGYQMIFNRLRQNQEKIIKHGLETFPLVDVYQLAYFKVICSKEDDKTEAWVNFYVYNDINEKRLKAINPPPSTIEIESTDPRQIPYKIPLVDMLTRYNVKYSDDKSVEEVLGDLWNAIFTAPNNDQFDDGQYCHSPWFDRCCRDEITVGTVKKNGEWDHLFFQMRPQKTINYELTKDGVAKPTVDTTKTPPVASGFQLPHNIGIVHHDFNTLGIELLAPPVYPNPPFKPDNTVINTAEEKVMLLLKV